jgi:hypothetical protein
VRTPTTLWSTLIRAPLLSRRFRSAAATANLSSPNCLEIGVLGGSRAGREWIGLLSGLRGRLQSPFRARRQGPSSPPTTSSQILHNIFTSRKAATQHTATATDVIRASLLFPERTASSQKKALARAQDTAPRNRDPLTRSVSAGRACGRPRAGRRGSRWSGRAGRWRGGGL